MLDPAVTQRVIDRVRRGPQQPSELAELTPDEHGLVNAAAGSRGELVLAG